MPLGQHPGLPGTTVIPDDWTATHQPIVARTLDCTVTIGPAAGAPVRDQNTRRTTASEATPVYTGPASVTPISTSDGAVLDLADDPASERSYEVKIDPAHAGADAIDVDHVVRVITAPVHSRVIGCQLRVTSIGTPGREFSRVLTAVLLDG